MALPFFYIDHYTGTEKQMVLNEETSKHIVQVLRTKEGEQVNLTDGKGHLLTCEIVEAHKKNCVVAINEMSFREQSRAKVTIAISLLKNANRFEWFLEKATEIGVSSIIPLLCDRTEKDKFRLERLQGIVISAMLQSQQVWLPVLQEPEKYEDLKKWKSGNGVNYIAHCIDSEKKQIPDAQTGSATLICIGPEGDFSPAEIELALQEGFVPVSLGDTRLRTETAGVVAAAILMLRK